MMIQSVYMCVCLVASSIKGAHGSQKTDFGKAIEAATNLETTIELTIAMENLPGFSFTARPFCITYTRPVSGRFWRKHDFTERLSKTNNPVFNTKVRIPYLLKDKQVLMFSAFNKYYMKGEDDILIPQGHAACKPTDLLSAGGRLKLMLNTKTGEEKTTTGKGYAVVYAEKLENPYDLVTMKLRSDNAEDKKICGGPKHYLEIYKRVEFEQEVAENKEDYIMVHRTEAKSNSYPKLGWKKISIPFSTLCGNDRERELKFVCLRGNNRIGEFKTTVRQMEKYKSVFPVTNEKKKLVGEITIHDFSINYVPSFTEFIAGGLKLRLTIAVDFSRRKNLVENPESFHYRGAGESKCEEVIRLVVTAFKDFVRNDQYDIRGFGAEKDVGGMLLLDDFKLYEDSDNSDGAKGLEGTLQAYRDALYDTSIQMRGKAEVAPIIHGLVAKTESHVPSSTNYFVLVVLTAGEIMAGSRMRSVLEYACTLRYLPLSIIFVGIGDVRFKNLSEMFKNGSTRLYRQSSFVFIDETELESDEDTHTYRKTEVLAKLPKQVATYMNSLGLKPGIRQP